MLLKKMVASALMVGAIVGSVSGALAASKDKATSGSVDLTNQEVTAFASTDVGGGTWSYGTQYVWFASKKVYSNYYHGSKEHSSTSQIGTLVNKSGRVAAETTSYSSAVGDYDATTHAYWNTY